MGDGGRVSVLEQERQSEKHGDERNRGCSPDDAVQTVDLLVGVGRVNLLLYEWHGD